MAVGRSKSKSDSRASSGRRFMVGTNVIIATVLVAAIVIVAQAIAFSVPKRWDMTSTGVNSLSKGSENLLRSLDQNVRLTSLYFETDREDQDQPRYRRAAEDLLDLYEANNRAKVTAEWINPLKDHDKFRKLLARLRDKTVFKKEIDAYRAVIDKYSDTLDAQMRDTVQSELTLLDGLGGSFGDSGAPSAVAPVENLLVRWSSMLEAARERVDSLTFADNPQYSSAVNELRTIYRDLGKALKDIAKYGADQVLRNPALPADQADFLREAGGRFADLVASIEEETTRLQELELLKFDDLLAQLEPTANPILVETDDDARVVDFSSVWPPIQAGTGGRAKFNQRAFKGEEKLTSAVLRVTHKEQTAVVFVRYGGQPLFLGGFMPGQPPAPYATMKQQLEDTNFVVREWDVKSSETSPEIDPPPTRTIYVVLKPDPPQRGPMGRPGPDPPFGENHRRLVLDAIGDEGRALFIAGWHPGPFGPIPSTYEFNDYLSDEWGVKVDTSALLIETMSLSPGKYVVGRRDFFNMNEVKVTEHAIVSGALARQLTLPWCAPLELGDSPPEGVEHSRLVRLPERDGLWGVKNIQAYQRQLEQREYMVKEEGDLEGPFDLAVAATKGQGKIVVVSARDFATDAVAFARQLAVGPRGFTIRSRNPGNVALLINSLHWLNDNTQFMNIGKPIDAAVLQVGSESTVKAVQALTIFGWPTLAMVCGGITWWIRRR